MKLECAEKNGLALFILEGEISIDDLESLQDEILIALVDYEGIVFDLLNVTECDVATLQLFYSTFLSTQKREKKFKLLNPSRAFVETIELVGFSNKDLAGYLESSELS